MRRSFERLVDRTAELGKQLQSELRNEFNLRGLVVVSGVTDDRDFAFLIKDLNSKLPPWESVAEVARDKLAAWEPESKPQIRCVGNAVARLLRV